MPDVSVLPYSGRARVSLAIARAIAASRGDRDVTPLHIVLGLLREGENPAVAALMHAGVAIHALRADVERALGEPRGGTRVDEVTLDLTPGEQRMVHQAQKVSRERGDEYLGPAHLFLALLEDEDRTLSQVLARYGVDAATASAHLDSIMANRQP